MNTQPKKISNDCEMSGQTGSVPLSLPAILNEQAVEHERSLVALLLIDRKCIREIDQGLSGSHFLDQFFGTVFSRLQANHWASLGDLLAGERFAARTIMDSICDPAGRDRVFWWNLKWHESEIVRLAEIRRRFDESLRFLLEYGEAA